MFVFVWAGWLFGLLFVCFFVFIIRRVMVAINTNRVDCGNIETTGTLRARQALLADDAALYSITKLRHQSWPVLREP